MFLYGCRTDLSFDKNFNQMISQWSVPVNQWQASGTLPAFQSVVSDGVHRVEKLIVPLLTCLQERFFQSGSGLRYAF